MSLGTFIAGRYSAVYGATPLDVGITREGYKLSLDTELEDVGRPTPGASPSSTGFGAGAIVSSSTRASNTRPVRSALHWPYGGALGGPGVLGTLYDASQTTKAPIGQLASALAAPLVLTATGGTPAATAPAIATLTATFALLAKNASLELMLNSKLRSVPTRSRLHPYTTSNITKFFATT